MRISSSAAILLNFFVLVGVYFNQFTFFYYSDTFTFKPLLHFFLQCLILKSILVNYRCIFGDLRIALLVNMAFLSRNSQNYVFILNSTINKPLDSCVDVKSSTVDNALCLASAVSQLLH